LELGFSNPVDCPKNLGPCFLLPVSSGNFSENPDYQCAEKHKSQSENKIKPNCGAKPKKTFEPRNKRENSGKNWNQQWSPETIVRSFVSRLNFPFKTIYRFGFISGLLTTVPLSSIKNKKGKRQKNQKKTCASDFNVGTSISKRPRK